MPAVVIPRQANLNENDDDGNDGWWFWSPEVYGIKWAIIGAIFLLCLILLLGAYFHAQRRMKKGLPPLIYHKWLVPRRQRARFEPQPQNNFSFYRAQDAYAMPGYPAPPPAYQPGTDYVPAYSPPQGASKVKPAQDYAAMPPPGPPPSHSYGAPSSPVPTTTNPSHFRLQ